MSSWTMDKHTRRGQTKQWNLPSWAESKHMWKGQTVSCRTINYMSCTEQQRLFRASLRAKNCMVVNDFSLIETSQTVKLYQISVVIWSSAKSVSFQEKPDIQTTATTSPSAEIWTQITCVGKPVHYPLCHNGWHSFLIMRVGINMTPIMAKYYDILPQHNLGTAIYFVCTHKESHCLLMYNIPQPSTERPPAHTCLNVQICANIQYSSTINRNVNSTYQFKCTDLC